MAAIFSPLVRMQFTKVVDGVVKPLANGRLYTFAAGTSTPLGTWKDPGQVTANTNPIDLDVNGFCDLCLGSSAYKFDLFDTSTGSEVRVSGWPVDNIDPTAYSNDALLAQTIVCFAGALPPSNPGQGQFWYQPSTGLWQYSGAAWVAVIDANSLATAINPKAPQLRSITATVAANALTVTLKSPSAITFRSATLADGTINTRTVDADVNLIVPDTATLGTVNTVAARLALVAIDNAGTVELAIVNLAGGNQLDETNLISTTAISTAADSNNVFYSTSARTNVPYRVVGFIDITEATAGTWATAPALVQGAGGASMNRPLGYGQTWQVVTGSRAYGSTYYNTTGAPIQLIITNTTVANISATVGGVAVPFIGYATGTIIVPTGQSYVVTSGGGALSSWSELR